MVNAESGDGRTHGVAAMLIVVAYVGYVVESNKLTELTVAGIGTLRDPIIVRSAGDEQLAGCTGYPVDSHWVLWCLVRPISPPSSSPYTLPSKHTNTILLHPFYSLTHSACRCPVTAL